jgi:hypothetical protein
MATFEPVDKVLNPHVIRLPINTRYVIGRSIKADYTLLNDKHAFCSRIHCEVVYNLVAETVTLTNLSEINGTFVGPQLDIRLEQGSSRVLYDGDKVSFGGRTLQRNESDDSEIVTNPFVYIVNISPFPIRESWNDAPDCVLCSVCQYSYHQPVVLGCGHVFCKSCIRRWSRTSTHSCPKCRTAFTDNELVVDGKLENLLIDMRNGTVSKKTLENLPTGSKDIEQIIDYLECSQPSKHRKM